MAISKKTWTGTAREATPGTAITVPTLYIPTKTVFKGGKKREYLNEERGDRNANYGVVDSVRQSSVEMKGPWYNDASAIMLWAGLGAPSSAVVVSPVVKHTFQLQDVPPSYTISRSLDAVTYYVPYGVLEKWALHFVADGKLLEVDSNWLGLYAQKNLTPPTPTYSTVLPFAGYAPTITTSAGVSTDIIDMQIDYEQKITLWYPANGTQDFITVYYGERKFAFNFTARFDNDSLYNLWRNNTLDNLTFDVKGPFILNQFTVSLGAPTAGTFTLTYKGQTTAGIAFNATAATVATALTGLSSVGANNATVSGGTGGPYTVQFVQALAQDPALLTGSGTGLTGGTFAITNQQFNQELSITFANTTYDTMEHDTTKDNVLMKVKGQVIVPAGSTLVTGFVQNTIANYTT